MVYIVLKTHTCIVLFRQETAQEPRLWQEVWYRSVHERSSSHSYRRGTSHVPVLWQGMCQVSSIQAQWIPDNSYIKYAKKLCKLSRMCELSIHQCQRGSIQLCKLTSGHIILALLYQVTPVLFVGLCYTN